MAGYQSILSGSRATNVLGNKDNPFASHYKPGQYYVKPQSKPVGQKPKQQQPIQQPKGQSLLSKVGKAAKSVGSSAITSERAIAKPVARLLPGGQNDIKAENAQIEQNIKTAKAANQMINSGNPKSVRSGKRLLLQSKNDTAGTNKLVKDTSKEIKETTNKKRITAGAFGTAADILTAGTYGSLAKGAKAGSLLARKGVSTAAVMGGNAAAGGLNAAAGGGDKRQVIENAAAGVALPVGLHFAGEGVKHITSKAANTIMDKVRLPKQVIQNAQTQAVLKAVEQQKTMDARVGTNSPTATIKQHLSESYTPASSHADEAFAHEHLTKNTEQALAAYKARTKQIFGSENIVSGDEAKYAVPGMSASKSQKYHEPASQFAKAYYKHLLKDPDTVDLPVMITAGGSGAGKTTALKKEFADTSTDPNDYAAIVDTNLTNVKSAVSRIEPALASGREVHVKFVYRDPVEAYSGGVIPRATEEGRAVEAGTHAETHAGSIDTIKEIADKYKDNPNVKIQVIDNSRGHNNSTPVSLDFLHNKSYTKGELETKIHQLLDNHLAQGKITNEQHTIFKGQKAQEAGSAVDKTGDNLGRVESQPNAKAVRQPEQKRPSPGGQGTKRPEGQSQEEVASSAGQSKLPVQSKSVSTPVKTVQSPAKVVSGESSAKTIPEAKVSGSASNAETRAVEAGLVREFADKSQYKSGSYKTEASNAVELLSKDPQKAKAIALGTEPGSNTMHEVAVSKAVENQALKDGDTKTLLELASSPRHTVTSEAAQRLGAEGYEDSTDVVKNIAALQRIRKEAVQKKLGTSADKAISTEVKQIRNTKPKPKVSKETFFSFVESLRC